MSERRRLCGLPAIGRADHKSDFGHITNSSSSPITMTANLIPFLLTMYIILAIVSAIGKDLIVELVTPSQQLCSNRRHGNYTFSSQSQFARNFPNKNPFNSKFFKPPQP